MSAPRRCLAAQRLKRCGDFSPTRIRLRYIDNFAQRRTVLREDVPELNDDSVNQLANCIATSAASPSKLLHAKETHRRVRATLELLTEQEREVLILRYLEEMPSREISMVLGIDEGSVRRRHRLAAQRLAELLGPDVNSS